MMGGRHQTGIHFEPALQNLEVVIACGEVDAAELLHLEAAAGCSEFKREALARDDAVAEAVEVRVAAGFVARHVVDEDDCRLAAREELL